MIITVNITLGLFTILSAMDFYSYKTDTYNNSLLKGTMESIGI